MAKTKVSVKWGKSKFDDVEVDLSDSPELLKAQLYALSGVPPDRQKLMIKGKILQNHSWGDVKLSNGMTIMMMGSADAVPVVPVPDAAGTKRTAAEQDDEEEDALPVAGLTNLGNTCYLNATLQCFRAVPELVNALKKFDGSFVGWESDTARAQSLTSTIKSLYAEMDTNPDKVIPIVAVETLRKGYPRFAERAENGGWAQQDANEVWLEILQVLRTQLPVVAPVALKEKAAESSGLNTAFSNAIEQYMSGEFTVKLRCMEQGANEPETVVKEKFLQLSCFISADTKYLQSGIISRMKETLTKRAESLGRDAQFEKTMKISRLPAYLTVQLVRFFYKEQQNVGAKILRDVKFGMSFDAYDLCTEELQKKVTPNRLKFKEVEDLAIDRKTQRMKSMSSTGKEEDEQPIGYAPFWFEDDVGSSNSGYYELKAVLTHQGRASNSGHYVAWVRRSDKLWIKFDDEKITAVSNEEILNLSGGGDWHTAYLLLYGPKRLPIYAEKPAEVQGMTLD